MGMLIGSIIMELILTYTEIKEIHTMAIYKCPLKTMRNGQTMEISSENLVPGDMFEIPIHKIMPCDAVLIKGSCMVNESMLTGESMPIFKTMIPADANLYHPDTNSLNTIYEGTEPLEN